VKGPGLAMKVLHFAPSMILTALLFCGALASNAADNAPAPAPNKVLVLLVFDKTCKVWCQRVRPVMKELKESYGTRVDVAELDSTQDVLEDSKKKAKELGVSKFFADVSDYVPIVLIFDAQRKLVKELPGPKPVEEYRASIDKALAHENHG
jgi:thioredoxin-related protein